MTDGTDLVGTVDAGRITRDVPRQPRESPLGVRNLPHLADPRGLATSDLVAEGINLNMQQFVVVRHRASPVAKRPTTWCRSPVPA